MGLDGIRRGAPRSVARPEPLPPPPPKRPNGPPTPRGGGFALLAIFLLAVGFAILRPNAPERNPEITKSAATATETTDNATPTRSFTPPQGGGVGDNLDDLVILDQPTDTSAPQEDAELPNDSSPQTQSDDTLRTESPTETNQDFTIRVLNGGGQAGAAAVLRDKLNKEGFEVTAVGNALATYSKTTIYYQANHRLDAEKVSVELSQPPANIEEDAIAAPADVLIVIGTDR